jgi:hypothetical protein
MVEEAGGGEYVYAEVEVEVEVEDGVRERTK